MHTRMIGFGASLVLLVLVNVHSARAATVWNKFATGTYAWNANGNWTLSAPDVAFPNATGTVANLSTVNVATGNVTIELNQNITVGQLLFGDTSGSQQYIINTGTGTNKLIFNNGGNSTLARVSGGGTGANTINAGIEVADTLKVYSAAGVLFLNGKLTGSGTLSIDATPGVASPAAIRVDGDISGFSGTIQANRVTTTGSATNYYRFNGAAASSYDGSGAKFILDGSTDTSVLNFTRIVTVNGSTFKMGELSGNGGFIRDDLSDSTAGNSMTLEVGNLNSNSQWLGIFGDQTTGQGTTAHFSKIGSGTLALGGNNFYKGTTTVHAGALLVNGNHATGSTYTVEGPGTLGGDGTISAGVDLFGAISPGGSVTGNVFDDTAGTLEIGGLTLHSGASTFFELDATDPNSINNDAIDVLGALTGTGGSFSINVEAFGGGDLAAANTWTLASYGSLAGTLPTITVNGVGSGYSSAVTFTNLLGGPGEVQLTLTVVPEPNAIILAGIGIIGLGLALKKKA